MTNELNIHRLLARLLANNSDVTREAAHLIAALLADLEEVEPKAKATEYELKWLLNHLRTSPVRLRGDAEEEGVTWTCVVDGMAQGYVAGMCSRLEALLRGDLPSESAFREGRRP